MTLMTLEKFADLEKHRLRLFESWWRSRSAGDREGFPLAMSPGEWDEQLHLFEEGNQAPSRPPKEKVRVGPAVATTAYIRKDQRERLQELSRKTGVPMAEYIRQGVGKVLKREGFK